MGSKFGRKFSRNNLPSIPTCLLKTSSFLLCPISANASSPTFPSNFIDSPDQNPEGDSSPERATSCYTSLASPLQSPDKPSATVSVHISASCRFLWLSPGGCCCFLTLVVPNTPSTFTIPNSTGRGFRFTWWNVGEQDKDHKDQD